MYNAPASHVSALLGLDGPYYTLVGDSSVGLSAVSLGKNLLEIDEVDLALIIASEELDGLTLDAYAQWPAVFPVAQPESRRGGMPAVVFSEGAAAMVLGKESASVAGAASERRATAVDSAYERTFATAREMPEALAWVLRRSCESGRNPDVAFPSYNGSALDMIESSVLAAMCPSALVVPVKRVLGEAPGASALWQTVGAVMALRNQNSLRMAVVTARGFNHQAGALLLSR